LPSPFFRSLAHIHVAAEHTSSRFATTAGSGSVWSSWGRSVSCLLILASFSLLIRLPVVTWVIAIVAVAERTRISSSKTGLALATVLGLSQAMTMMTRQQAEVENNMASAERLLHFANATPKEAPAFIESTAPPQDWPSSGAISIRNAEVRYRPELPPVLHDVSLDILAGEQVGVVGRTGAGTLFFLPFFLLCLLSRHPSSQRADCALLNREIHPPASPLPHRRALQRRGRNRRYQHWDSRTRPTTTEARHHPARASPLSRHH
jgi:hypothetical protein